MSRLYNSHKRGLRDVRLCYCLTLVIRAIIAVQRCTRPRAERQLQPARR